jgi:hypothetical protein
VANRQSSARLAKIDSEVLMSARSTSGWLCESEQGDPNSFRGSLEVIFRVLLRKTAATQVVEDIGPELGGSRLSGDWPWGYLLSMHSRSRGV